jgi:hypothetical protein
MSPYDDRTLGGGAGTFEDLHALRRDWEHARLLDWLHTFSRGATPERLRAEVARLQGLYSDDDLRRIIVELKTGLARPPRRLRARTTIRWNSAEAIQAKHEITALHKTGLTQIEACERWLEMCRGLPSRCTSPIAQVDAQSLLKQVFQR